MHTPKIGPGDGDEAKSQQSKAGRLRVNTSRFIQYTCNLFTSSYAQVRKLGGLLEFKIGIM